MGTTDLHNLCGGPGILRPGEATPAGHPFCRSFLTQGMQCQASTPASCIQVVWAFLEITSITRFLFYFKVIQAYSLKFTFVLLSAQNGKAEVPGPSLHCTAAKVCPSVRTCPASHCHGNCPADPQDQHLLSTSLAPFQRMFGSQPHCSKCAGP